MDNIVKDDKLITDGLTNKIALTEIVKLYNMGFDFNSKCDRASYVLSVSMNYPNLGEFVHHQLAHRITGDEFSDKIEYYGELRHDLFYRDALEAHYENYNSVSDLFEELTLSASNIQNQCIKTIKIAAETNDFGYEDLLREINKDFLTPLLKQCMMLQEASKKYDRDNKGYKFEKDFVVYLIDPFKGE